MDNMLSEKVLQQIIYFTNLLNRQQHNSSYKTNDILASRSQAHLLRLLLTEDGLTQKDLSDKLQIRPASLGELVNKLQQNGYVEKRANEKDKRVSNVYITEEGRRVTEDVVQKRKEFVQNIFSGLSEDEVNQLSVLIDKLVDSMEESSDENVEELRKNHHGIKEVGN